MSPGGADDAAGPAPSGGGGLTRERIERWELFGAPWRVVRLDDDHVEVEFATCEGRPAERAASADRDVIAYVRSRDVD